MQDDNQLYMLLGELKAGIAAIRETLSTHDAEHTKYREAVDERLNAHSHRLTKLEQFRWKMAGVAITVPAVLTLVGLLLSR